MEKLSLVNINNGAAVEVFDRELDNVVNNMKDVNTDAEAERSITLTVKFKPGPDRSSGVTVVESKVKLVGIKASRGSMFVIGNQGKNIAYPKDPRQDVLFSDQSGSKSQ